MKALNDKALKPDEKERSVLALRLLDGMGEAPEVIKKAGVEVVRERLKDIDDGTCTPVVWDDAKQRILGPDR